MSNLIITGIPRSGTTLAAAIIDQSDNAFCLSEPDSHVELMQASQSAEEFVAQIVSDFVSTRRTLLVGESVLDKRWTDGQPVTNYFSDVIPDRPRELAFTPVKVSRSGLAPNFLLGAKHNALYAAVLPEIVRSGQFRVIAIIRNPVAVLKSWRSLDLPISSGRLPAAERFWSEMAHLSHSEMELLEKQIRIYELICRRFAELSHQIKIIRYEVFTADPGSLLAAAGGVGTLRTPIRVGVPAGNKHELMAEDRALSAQIYKLAADGSLPALCSFYPQYRSVGS